MSRSFEIPSGGRVSLARTLAGVDASPALDAGRRRLSLFDLSERDASLHAEDPSCRAR
jgi:hypothetical protein